MGCSNQKLRLVPVLTLCVALLICARPVRAGTLYFNDFEDPTDPLLEWSNPSTSTTPSGRRFLGEFQTDLTTLTLENVPPNTEITLGFELFVIRSWDGNGSAGPDIWELSVTGGDTLLHTTFSNATELTNPGQSKNQSFPEDYPLGDNPAQTGACRFNTLGYSLVNNGDSVYCPEDPYSLGEFVFLHPGGTLEINFAGLTLASGALEEAWGIDNIYVTPEPGTLCLLCLGGLLASRRRR